MQTGRIERQRYTKDHIRRLQILRAVRLRTLPAMTTKTIQLLANLSCREDGHF